MFGAITYRRPINLVLAVDILAFILLLLYSKEDNWKIAVISVMLITLILIVYFAIIKKNIGDEYLFLIVAMLISLGFIMICRLDPDLGFKQMEWLILGVATFFVSYYVFIKVKTWDVYQFHYILISIAIYLVTLIFGRSIKGATNWIIIGGFSFQTSEMVKILYIFFLASFYKNSNLITENTVLRKFSIIPQNIERKLFLMLITFVNLGFLVLQREWGTVVLLMILYFITLYISGSSYKFIILNALPSASALFLGYEFLAHIRIRVETWLNPWTDISGKGYQITQSLFAISAGGFFGTGIGMGKPDLIPVADTDFIFSAICEEMGIFGGVAIVLLFLILSYRGFKIAMSISDTFYKFIALSITAMFGFQTFIIIGGVIKFIPMTGITLPFISYGGSSLLTSFITLGILQAISKISSDGERSLVEDE